MLFNSFNFLIFFPVVATLYFVLPHRYRWALLLVASIVFYAAFIPYYVLVMFALIIIDYCAGLGIERIAPQHKKSFLLLSIFSTVAALVVFKYFNFFNANFAAIAELIGWNYSIPMLALALPIGLSFHTFQSLSYVIEVYRGTVRAERHFGIYALYVMFFPQLVAGPIERPQHMLHQFHEAHVFDGRRAIEGLKRMAWGMFKKIVVADRLALFVDAVYAHPGNYGGLHLIIATIFFAFQIYCDFSGYADIAIGSANVMGFRLMENFRAPYLAISVADFWRRWHISLSSWFRDYVYIPLGGNRVLRARWCLNVLVVFLLSGLWHGASWNFVIWGALHGIFIVLSFFAPFSWIPHGAALLWTFALTTFSWIFFRAPDLSSALYIVTHLFSGWTTAGISVIGRFPFMLSLVLIAIVVASDRIAEKGVGVWFARRSVFVRWSFYVLLVLATLFFGVFTSRDFIYFQF